MGTSGAYSGSGGKDGRALRDAIADYIQETAGPAHETKQPDPDDQKPAQASQLDPEALRRVLNLIRLGPVPVAVTD
jgi:hypothetical protein